MGKWSLMVLCFQACKTIKNREKVRNIGLSQFPNINYLGYEIFSVRVSIRCSRQYPTFNHRKRRQRRKLTPMQMRRKTCGPLSSRFTTISSHFFDNFLYIFHKTEVQTVILRCWTGLNHNWFKSYDTKCKRSQKE